MKAADARWCRKIKFSPAEKGFYSRRPFVYVQQQPWNYFRSTKSHYFVVSEPSPHICRTWRFPLDLSTQECAIHSIMNCSLHRRWNILDIVVSITCIKLYRTNKWLHSGDSIMWRCGKFWEAIKQSSLSTHSTIGEVNLWPSEKPFRFMPSIKMRYCQVRTQATEACRENLITQQHYPDDTNEPLFWTFFLSPNKVYEELF